MSTNSSGFACMECGKKFRTIRAAEKASSEGCPRCGGCDVDLDVSKADAYRAALAALPVAS